MTKHTLAYEKRTALGRKVKNLRKNGMVPGNVYSKAAPSENVQVKLADFEKLYKQVGESTLVYLGDKPTLIRQIVRHPVSGQILHLEFNQVNLKEKVKAQVKIVVIGEAPAVKDGMGIMVQQADHIEIEALPADMPEHFEVDISKLSEAGQAITINDLKLNNKFTALTDPETVLVRIEELAKEEVKEAPAVEAAPAAAVDETTPGPVVS